MESVDSGIMITGGVAIYCPGTWAHTCMYIEYMWIKVEGPCPKQGGEQACLVVYVLERSDHRVVVIL